MFSAASLWEVSIKASLGREDFKVEPGGAATGIAGQWLHRTADHQGEHAVSVDALPPIHKVSVRSDAPAQALSEGITLLTTDANLARYRGPLRKV